MTVIEKDSQRPEVSHGEDHEWQFLTAPNARPQRSSGELETQQFQRGRSPHWLVHNHPSGDPTPSQADIQMTQQIVAVAGPLGIAVHDHIIVGKEGHASLKGLKLM